MGEEDTDERVEAESGNGGGEVSAGDWGGAGRDGTRLVGIAGRTRPSMDGVEEIGEGGWGREGGEPREGR